MLPHVADKFREFHRICQELQDISQHQYQTHIDNTTINAIHIRLLLQEIDEKQWGRYLAINEKKRKRDTEVQEVFGAFRMVAVELINRVHRYSDKKYRSFTDVPILFAEQFINDLFIEIQELIRMINDAFRTISIAHSYSVPYIDMRIHDQHIEFRLKTINFTEEAKKKRQSSKKVPSIEVDEKEDVPVTDNATNDATGDVTGDATVPAAIPENVSTYIPVYPPASRYRHDDRDDRDDIQDLNYDSDGTDAQTQDALLQVYNQMRPPL
jgi:hypothetical protein